MVGVRAPAARTDLVGRDGERADLLAALATARSGQAGGVLVAGDAGVGKSRLLEEVAETARAAGDLVLVGQCLDVGEAALPYLPFTKVAARLTIPLFGQVSTTWSTPARPAMSSTRSTVAWIRAA